MHSTICIRRGSCFQPCPGLPLECGSGSTISWVMGRRLDNNGLLFDGLRFSQLWFGSLWEAWSLTRGMMAPARR